ncbi:MAG TPA: acyltransferase [Myxococcaceae bacterium]|nr:acyltransferase [Myxococcaceae bacterium]
MGASTTSALERNEGLDVLRGTLLVAMLAVHVVSAHAPTAHAAAMQTWFGVFLISSGFVALSGFVAGARRGSATRADALESVESAVRLLLVMVAYSVIASLVRHAFALASGGPSACAAVSQGWVPPRTFESLGILLPIALVQLAAPAARLPRAAGPLAAVSIALAFALLTGLADWVGDGGILGVIWDVFVRRELTPYYTVTMFVAVGVLAAALGRSGLLRGPRGWPARLSLVAAAVGLATPALSSAVLDLVFSTVGAVAGALAMLVYWSLITSALLAAFSQPFTGVGGAARRLLSLLGRHSLLVFVLHVFLLEVDMLARAGGGFGKTPVTTAALFAVNLALLVAGAAAAERWPRTRAAAHALLLDRRSSLLGARSGAFGIWGALALVAVLGVYSGSALARPSNLTLDDAEGPEGCPAWWTFGETQVRRSAADDPERHGARVLEVRGRAPGAFAHGMGLYLEHDAAGYRALEMDVRGYGPASGRIKIELGEDDDGNWEIQKDRRTFRLLHDDLYVFELIVDWEGWRRVTIPLRRFVDANPGVGNDLFDPARDLTSGGLLELQLLFAPTSAGEDAIRIDFDHLRFTP